LVCKFVGPFANGSECSALLLCIVSKQGTHMRLYREIAPSDILIH